MNIFKSSSPPYVIKLSGDLADSLCAEAERMSWRFWKVNLANCGAVSEIYAAFSRVMDFPIPTGRNWNALNDMLADLEWAPAAGHLILLSGLNELRRAHPAEHEELIDVLTAVGEHWHSWHGMAHPFKVVVLG